jgi:hypothetical protein
LEGGLKKALSREDPMDREAWEQALRQAVPGRRKIVAYGVAAGLLVAGAMWVILHGKGHTDLVVAVVEHHKKMMKELSVPLESNVDLEAINRKFAESFHFPAQVATKLPESARLILGRSCYLEGVPVAYLFFHVDDSPVSVFLLGKESLSRFPQGGARLASGALHFDCHIDEVQFCALDRGDRVACLAGRVSRPKLEALAMALNREEQR